jgi:Kef-type K+ transport system membrane component KefB
MMSAFAQAQASIATLIEISTPKGAEWEFLVVFATLLLGPVLVQRARVPGIIGLLLGGYVIGPHGLGVIGAGNNTLPDLGQLGLLYLMFVAGVELDLNLLRRYRRSTIVFGLLTFALPMILGTSVGLGLGWEAQAAILLGALLASHTLITYPTVRAAGLTSDPAVATAVGSTVLTDTLALVVLAGVAGSVGGDRSGIEVAVQIAVGLIVLVVYSLTVLPLLAGWAFRRLGAERSVRYVVAITAFLSAATVAELFGIEGIVGAFFAGLALNRLVPNEGQLMDRIGFFGGAVFIPVFLVSVGLILNPAVMVKGETLELAGLFILACLGGKVLAAALSARLLGFSRAQAGLLFSLSSAQAAATLAATVIGFQLGLFDSAVVNAVLVVILVSVLASTIVGARASARLPAYDHGPQPLGTRVVVGVDDPATAGSALSVGVRMARADGGVVHPVLVLPDTAPIAPRALRARFMQVIAAAGADGLPSTIVDRSLLHGALRAAAAHEATLVLVSEPAEANSSGDTQAVDGSTDMDTDTGTPYVVQAPPIAVVRGSETLWVDAPADSCYSR